MPKGGRHGNLSKPASKRYEGIKAGNPGLSKGSAARIANAGKTKADRSAMAKKAARTRAKE